MPRNRTIPPAGIAAGQDIWARLLDISEKVAVVWVEGPDDWTVESYESTVSAANTTRNGAVKANGAKPDVMINWWHSDVPHENVGALVHVDAGEDLPAWIDAVANT